jgi:hypothetical protein
MTDLEEIPDNPTPMSFELLPDIQPAPEKEPEEGSHSMKKVLHRMTDETAPRRGGLSG